MNESRLGKLARRINSLAGFGDITGASILEIGGDAEGHAAKMLLDAGARNVISINHSKKWPTEKFGDWEKRRVDARNLEEAFEPQSIDIVFGISVLEHISGLKKFFSGARHILKPGGLFFAHGAPIWSCGKGHHVFVNGVKRKYRFGSRETNPIADWSHLLHTQSSLVEELISQKIPPVDAEKIGDWVYQADKLNRIGFQTMCETFGASGFSLIDQLISRSAAPPPELLDAIERGPYAGQGRYDVSGVTFVGRT